MKKHLLLLFAALLPLLASAQTKVEINGIWYNLTSETKQAEVTFKGSSYNEYTGEYSGSITIPATVTYGGAKYSVTSIGERAFSSCSSLTSITIPEGVTSIRDDAFYECSSLTAVHISDIAAWCNIKFSNYDSNPLCYAHNLYLNGELVTQLTIPKGVTSIGDYAFYGCNSLTSINIPKGVTSIGDCAFYECSSLTTITIPEGVTGIGRFAFNGCSSLTSINIPTSVTSIGDHAFSGCSSLTAITVAKGNAKYDSRGGCNAIIETNSNTLIAGCSTTIIPEGVTSIGDEAFFGCSSLTAINIPESVTSIGGHAFFGCSSLTAISISESVTSIGYAAFGTCSSLTAITLPEGVTSIGDLTFYGCSSLTSINIPESVTSIGNMAFYCCSSLTTITIPESVTSIGDNAFAYCSSLSEVYCYAENVPSTETNAFDGSYPENATLHVPESALEAYKNTEPWSEFGNIVALGTGIEQLTSDKSQLTIYDLSGRRVEKAEKGIYIIGGKKVVIK